jgi:hypothetical protein
MSRFKRTMDGLPGRLPTGEPVLWQGKPMAFALARRAFRTRLIVGYFALLIVWRFSGALTQGHGLAAAFLSAFSGALLGAAALGLFYGFAFLIARSTTYTITAKRVVITYGVALPKSLNLPFSKIAAADLAVRPESGDIVLTTEGKRLSYALLWPHVHAGPRGRTQPTLRCVADAKGAADILGRAIVPSTAAIIEADAMLAHAA